jgi:hypothetical protein
LYDVLATEFGAERLIMDIDTLSPGVDFRAAIEAAVRSAAVVLDVIGPNWPSDRLLDPEDFVAHELAVALSMPGTRVIPVLVDGALIPRMENLPTALAPLARRNALRLDDSTWDSDV